MESCRAGRCSILQSFHGQLPTQCNGRAGLEMNAKEMNIQTPSQLTSFPQSGYECGSEGLCQTKQHLNCTNYVFKG